MLKSVLGKRKQSDDSSDSSEDSFESRKQLGKEKEEDSSTTGSESNSDSNSDSQDDSDDQSSDEQDDGDQLESLPTCQEAISNPIWKHPSSPHPICLLCPDKKIMSNKKKDYVAFHQETSSHKRRHKRFQIAVEKALAKSKPKPLPRDPRDLVQILDSKIGETMQKAKDAKKPWRKGQSTDPAKLERLRQRKLHKADKKANREHRKRAKKGLPFDPSIDETALQTKLKLGWTQEQEDAKEDKKARKKETKAAKREAQRAEDPELPKDEHAMPPWKVASKVKKLEKQLVKRHKRDKKAKKAYDPAHDTEIHAKIELLQKAQAVYLAKKWEKKTFESEPGIQTEFGQAKGFEANANFIPLGPVTPQDVALFKPEKKRKGNKGIALR